MSPRSPLDPQEAQTQFPQLSVSSMYGKFLKTFTSLQQNLEKKPIEALVLLSF